MSSRLRVVSFGGGVNSVAMLVGLWQRGEAPDAILFADTGGEWPETYATVAALSAWCEDHGFPSVETVHNRSQHPSLEQECLTNKTLPSLAYGFKGCSVKWKRQPMDQWLRDWGPAQSAWGRGEKIERLIGIDADEAHRSAGLGEDRRFVYRRPLIEWGWGRNECVAAIESAGLEVPRKSACWFCPATKRCEVIELAMNRPDLFERAVAMEHNAAGSNHTVEGLGRRWSWEGLVMADRAQLRLFPEAVEEPCGCYDGETDTLDVGGGR